MYRIQITEPAKADIERAFAWWSENRSPEEVSVWYERIFQAITTLKQMPQRCPTVSEMGLSIAGVRQLLFGVSRHPTHRIVFLIEGRTVTVLRVRHHGQDVLDRSDIGN